MQGFHHIPDQARRPRCGSMPEKRRETEVGPGDSLHSARPGTGVQCMGSVAMLNPEAASLPASAWDYDAFVPTLIVLVGGLAHFSEV